LRAAVPNGCDKAVTLVAGLRLCGYLPKKLSTGRSTPPRLGAGSFTNPSCCDKIPVVTLGISMPPALPVDTSDDRDYTVYST
jgi:hypothetical protein